MGKRSGSSCRCVCLYKEKRRGGQAFWETKNVAFSLGVGKEGTRGEETWEETTQHLVPRGKGIVLFGNNMELRETGSFLMLARVFHGTQAADGRRLSLSLNCGREGFELTSLRG